MKQFMKVLGIGAAVILCLALFIVSASATTDTKTAGNIAVGSVSATGAAINISLGWTPKYVIVSNPATTSPTKMEWWTGMAAASGLRSVASATTAGGATTVPIVSRVTVSGISSYAGTTSAAKGFTIGADTSLNISGDTLYYEAVR